MYLPRPPRGPRLRLYPASAAGRNICHIKKEEQHEEVHETDRRCPGGRHGATTTLAILSYREAFVSNDLGSGAAVTTVWMLLMMLVVFVYNRVFRAEDMT